MNGIILCGTDMQPQTRVRQKASQVARGRFGVKHPSNDPATPPDNSVWRETDVLQLFN